MSTQSILKLSRETYADEAEENMLTMADAYFYHKYFLISKKPDQDRVRHSLLFYKILCPDNCQVANYIQDKITGKLEERKKPPKKKNLNYLMDEYCKEDDNERDHWVEIEW